jgi:hypothetical protein
MCPAMYLEYEHYSDVQRPGRIVTTAARLLVEQNIIVRTHTKEEHSIIIGSHLFQFV